MNKNQCSFNYNFSISIGSTFLILLCALLLICGCVTYAQDNRAKLFFDEEVTFKSGFNEIFGILTLPTTKNPHPAIVLLHGSDRVGVDSPYYKDHFYNLVQSGFSVLRYDSPGWGGRSSGSYFRSEIFAVSSRHKIRSCWLVGYQTREVRKGIRAKKAWIYSGILFGLVNVAPDLMGAQWYDHGQSSFSQNQTL